jgi:hypothetical protein
MDTIFTLGDATNESTKLNLDELYERKQQQDLKTLELYNRILLRIHARIKTVSRQQTKEQYCWYIMPETIIGVPKYDYGACTAYIIDQLRENGFLVNYTHPNLLLISWAKWCPSYVRNEIKKKTGIIIDGTGNRLDKNDGEKPDVNENPNELMFHRKGNDLGKPAKEYKSIDTYKPSGLIYNENLLRKIEDKTRGAAPPDPR